MPQQSLPVLVVDDDAVYRATLGELLEEEGIEFESVADGDEAITRLQQGRYCAVLLDLMLPGANGFTVLTFLKQSQPMMLDRVVVVTGMPRGTIERTAAAVAGRVFIKPFNPRELLDCLRRCVGSDR